jgi:hypothetical protein
MKYVFKALKPLNTCWSVGKKVVEMAVRQLCQLCAARVTWYSFHSCTSDAALLCSQCSRGRCPNVPNGHIHAAKFATASSVIKSENDKKIATRQRLQDVPKKQMKVDLHRQIQTVCDLRFQRVNEVTARRRHLSGHGGIGMAITRRRLSQIAEALACCIQRNGTTESY